MSPELITRIYTVLLVVKALMLSLLTARCAYAIYRNHLYPRARIVILGTAAMSTTLAADSWLRSWGRIQQWISGILANQVNALPALITLLFANIGIILWIMSMEITTGLGIKPGTPHDDKE